MDAASTLSTIRDDMEDQKSDSAKLVGSEIPTDYNLFHGPNQGSEVRNFTVNAFKTLDDDARAAGSTLGTRVHMGDSEHLNGTQDMLWTDDDDQLKRYLLVKKKANAAPMFPVKVSFRGAKTPKPIHIICVSW